MTAEYIIERVRSVKPNVYSDTQLLDWIDEVEADIYGVLNAHSDSGGEYGGLESITDKLLLDKVYQNIYIFYLYAQIDYANAEINLYNNDVSIYSQLLDEFAKKHRRENVPKKNTVITTEFTAKGDI